MSLQTIVRVDGMEDREVIEAAILNGKLELSLWDGGAGGVIYLSLQEAEDLAEGLRYLLDNF